MGIATVGGAGFFPFAPGTVGSAVGVAIYMVTRHWSALPQGLLLAAITLVGIWAAGVAETALAREDPGPVIIDEVAGQLVTLFLTGVGWSGALVGFLLFRVLDIIKPFPARQFERLHGGLGIMADDLMAGVYGLALMMLLLRWWPGAW
ncbi:MAG: phosphatidylglycerophosphatase A [Acidobacteria bacterium]|nr:phosphatidylglycerophosphatase A [Acidobacteriota bacterium]